MPIQNKRIKITQYAPVIIPTLNRFKHFKQCIESLQQCTHANKTELIIGIDYPPSEKYVEGWKKIKKYASSITGFKKVTIFNHKENLGPSNNIDFLREFALRSYDSYILSEDDNIFSPCFLDYINKCLEYYKYDKNIQAISGYMHPIKWKTQTNSTITYMKDSQAYGIALRKEWFQEMEKNMPLKYLDYVCNHRKLLKKLKAHPRNLYQFIFWIKSNPSLNRRCDFTIANYLHISGKSIICPKLSLVRNIGYDGSGEHCCKLENDIFSNQTISNQKKFILYDNLSKSEIQDLQYEFEYWSCNYSPNSFTKKDEKKLLRYYYLYMIFGYSLGNKISDFILLIISKIKQKCPVKIKKFIKKALFFFN